MSLKGMPNQSLVQHIDRAEPKKEMKAIDKHAKLK